MSLDIFEHLDFQTLLNYEDILADPESEELYDIHKEGHEKWGQIYLTPLQEYYILDAYYNCGTTPKISAEHLQKDLLINAQTIRKVLRRYGDIRNLSEAMKLYKVNEDYFESIDTPEKAYWLGLLSADGHVTKEGDRVMIALQEKDGYLVEQFARDIGYTGVIETTYNKSTPDSKSFPQRRVRINSRKMAQDLTKWGCSTTKTEDLRFPHWMNEELRPHFARGFIDGDGWVALKDRQYNSYLEIGWCGTWAMVFELSAVISNHTTYFNPSTYSVGTIYSNLTAGRFAIEIGDWIYKDSTRRMERKYDNYAYAKENFKPKRRNLYYGLT